GGGGGGGGGGAAGGGGGGGWGGGERERVRQPPLAPQRREQRGRVVRARADAAQEAVEAAQRRSPARERGGRQPTALERGEVAVHERERGLAPVGETMAARKRRVVAEVQPVGVHGARREPAAAAQLVEPAVDPGRQSARDRLLVEPPARRARRTRGGRLHDRGAPRAQAAPSRRASVSATVRASDSDTWACSAMDSGVACLKASTEPNALSSAARRAGPTPGTRSSALPMRARVRSLRW